MADGTPWEATLEDMHMMADDLASGGWETLTVVAGDTGAVTRDAGTDSDNRLGLVHVIQGDDADRLDPLVEDGSFSTSEAYVAVAGDTEYAVTVLKDPGECRAVLIASAVAYDHARDCFDEAAREGTIATYLQRLDGTPVATFEHDDPTLFEPPA
ncbi:hypothetical protein CV102_17760 [Natronococcus pandeyae]|uniref:Uncharacterized protein n=1 Tax=Natronococcus pandeyae TaxID=2055836 RepID=A0A8J8Q2D8_9EURY|nr:hypothetical protein [Natronococcus pandeyae]TYL37173.1 hypothetical protein CV102_17760 [Natronococcus pandeyae]